MYVSFSPFSAVESTWTVYQMKMYDLRINPVVFIFMLHVTDQAQNSFISKETLFQTFLSKKFDQILLRLLWC